MSSVVTAVLGFEVVPHQVDAGILVGACRSLNLFPQALEAIRQDAGRAEALISCKLPIEQVQRGFGLISQSKSSVVKAVIVFGD